MSILKKGLKLLVVGLIAALLIAFSQPSPADATTPSPIAQRLSTDSALRAMLGAAKTGEFSVASGREQDFEWGSLYYSGTTGVHEVHGAIWARYKSLGGPAGKLSFPTTDETHVYAKYDVPDEQIGARNDFSNGALEWISQTNQTVWMGKAIAAAFPHQTYPYWGIPTQDQHGAAHGAQVLTWGTYGLIYATSAGTTYLMNTGYPGGSNGILDAYRLAGMDSGYLGLPTADEVYVPATAAHIDGRMQTFNGGAIYQRGVLLGLDSDATAAYAVRGAIYWSYSHNNGLETLGYPTSNEMDAPGGRISNFQHGTIYWNAAKNTIVTTVAP